MIHLLDGVFLKEFNSGSIFFIDDSNYIAGITVEVPALNILSPDMDCGVNIPYLPNHVTTVKPVDIGLYSFNSGIYKVTQSVRPNDKVLKEHLFFYNNEEKIWLSSNYDLERENLFQEIIHMYYVIDCLCSSCEYDKAVILYKLSQDRLKILKECYS